MQSKHSQLYYGIYLFFKSLKKTIILESQNFAYIKWVNHNTIYDKLCVNLENLPIMALQHTVGM